MALDIKAYLKKCGPLYNTIGSLHLYLNRHKQLCDVPVEICTNPMGFSLAPGGWNYLIEQLKEFDRESTFRVEDSVLFKFHRLYQPNDMSDLPLSTGANVTFKPGLSIYPWGYFKIEESQASIREKKAYTSRFYGPSSLALVEKDLTNLRKLYEYIKVHGYKPWRFKKAFVGGVFLERKDGQRKFVVLQGNHRTAIMSHLGCKSIQIRYLKGYYKCIYEENMKEWLYVKTGDCTEKDAKIYFNSLFTLNGHERAKRMGFE